MSAMAAGATLEIPPISASAGASTTRAWAAAAARNTRAAYRATGSFVHFWACPKATASNAQVHTSAVPSRVTAVR